MPALAEQLSNFIDTINEGPAALNPDLFTGPDDRILLGLKAHANTISHARLVALEETFPMIRAEMGDAAFNELSRSYTETPQARAADNSGIGSGFPAFLAAGGLSASLTDLAQIEWAWLECYHAAEADALAIETLAGMDEAAMLSLPVQRHPAARVVMLHAPLSPQLSELGDVARAAAVLITRPDSAVLLQPIDRPAALLMNGIDDFSNMGNLLQAAIEHVGEEGALEPILSLIGAGGISAGALAQSKGMVA